VNRSQIGKHPRAVHPIAMVHPAGAWQLMKVPPARLGGFMYDIEGVKLVENVLRGPEIQHDVVSLQMVRRQRLVIEIKNLDLGTWKNIETRVVKLTTFEKFVQEQPSFLRRPDGALAHVFDTRSQLYIAQQRSVSTEKL